MLKNLTYCGLMLIAGEAFGQAYPSLGLRPHRTAGVLLGLPATSSKVVAEPIQLPGTHSRLEARYALAPLLGGAPLASPQVLPSNRLVYYQLSSPLATGASLAGAVAGWLLGADPQVQAYQQYRQFTGRDNVVQVPRQARPDDLLR